MLLVSNKTKLIAIHEDKKLQSQYLNLLKCIVYLKENLNLHVQKLKTLHCVTLL
jgi:hypothetical protein